MICNYVIMWLCNNAIKLNKWDNNYKVPDMLNFKFLNRLFFTIKKTPKIP